MRRRNSMVIGALGCVCGVTAAASYQAPQQAAPAPTAEAKPGAGRDVLLRMCTECHGLADVIVSRRSREQWRTVVDRMLDKGAAGTDEEVEATLRYLTTAYGRVNVNKAPAEEIAIVLGVTPEQADAIVTFRSDNGPFADFDALTRVSGLESDQLTKVRDAIVF